jgi:hypothetical protein
MPGKPYPTDVVAQGQAVLEAWLSIDPQLKVGSQTPDSLEGKLAQSAPIERQIDKLDALLTDMRNQRDALCAEIWDVAKRVRATVKGVYGDDSSQYEMIGGTRLSERKPVSRRQPAA